MQRHQLSKAESYYERLEPPSQGDQLNLGRIYLAQRNFDKAILHAQKIVSENKSATPTYLILGSSYLMQDDLLSAKKNFIEAGKLAPNFFLPRYYIGLTHSVEGAYQSSIDAFDNTLKIAPNLKEAILCAAIVSQVIGGTAKSRDLLTKYQKIAPDDFLYLISMGNLFISEHDFKQADQYYKRADTLFVDFGLANFKTYDYFGKFSSAEMGLFSLANFYFREGLFNKTIELVAWFKTG